MMIWNKILRTLFLMTLAIYIGGFTFYSMVVIPILHDRLESAFETGLVTQRVTVALNGLGAATLAIGWCSFGLDAIGRRQDGGGDRWRGWTLLGSSLCLVALVVLHRVMDQRLESGTLTGFYPWHRAYLWVSTVQWVVNLALLIRSSAPLIPSRESRR